MDFDFLNILPAKPAKSFDLPYKKTVIANDEKITRAKPEFLTKKARTDNAEPKDNKSSGFAKAMDDADTAQSSKFATRETSLIQSLDTGKEITDTQDTAKSEVKTQSEPQEDVIIFKTKLATPLPIKGDKKEANTEASNIKADTIDNDTLLVDARNNDYADFFTPVGHVEYNEDNTPLTEEALSNILALNTDIKVLLQNIKNAAPRVEAKENIIAPQSTDTSLTDEQKNIYELFSLVLTALDTNPSEEVVSTDKDTRPTLHDISQQIKTVLEDDNAPITANFTPEQLTNLQKILEDILKAQSVDQDDLKQLNAIAAQIVVLKPIEIKAAEASAVITAKKPDTIDLAAPEKAEVQPEATKDFHSTITLPEKHFTQSRYDARYDIKNAAQNNTADPNNIDFKSALNDAKTETQALKTANDNTAGKAAGGNPLQNNGLSNLESALSPLTGSSSLTTTAAASQTTTQSFQSTLTNVVTQSSSASYPHPATQAVVATLHKAVKSGDDTNIKLQLDPPELGRVEVKMSIDKNSKTRIVLTAEKSETLFLLQKDSQILDRALQNAGLDTAQGSLSFELAKDNQNFGGNSRGGGHDTGGKGSSGATEDAQIIDTVMNWQIDPQTGAMRYNAIV